MARLADAFGPARGGLSEAALEQELARICEAGRTAWPDVALSDEVFVAHVAARVAGEADLARALAELHAADLYLACAASRGVPRAVEVLRGELATHMPAWLGSLRLGPDRIDEVTQAVVTRLLVARPPPDPRPPRVADYGGRGPLRGWMRVAAVRTALNASARERPQDRSIEEAAVPERLLGPPGTDVELDLIRFMHKEEFAAAFRAALDALEPRERLLLGLHWLDGVPTTRLGAMYGVHRTTVGRWLDEAQERVLAGTRAELAGRLGVSGEEADSLIRLLRSRLDVSLRVLRDRD